MRRNVNSPIALFAITLGTILGVLLIVGIFAAVYGLVIWALWNWVIAGIFKAPVITFWQGLGLGLVLSIISSFFRRK